MTLFGTTLGGAEIASLVAMLATLVLWFGVLRNQRGQTDWIRRRLAEREAKEEAGSSPAPDGPPDPRRPWG
ncbi:MAG: hypothetical protein EON87_20940 [Brevundimonas sp.]|nr:MAG: hypothetical protein EON87_20940 [Brevundimonas sp.]